MYSIVGAICDRPPEIEYNFRFSEGKQYFIACGNVVLFQNHRAITDRPYIAS